MKYTEEYLKKYGIVSVKIISEDNFKPKLIFEHVDGYIKYYILNANLVQDMHNSLFFESIVEKLIDNYIIKNMRKLKLNKISEI